MGFSTKAEIPLALNSYSLHTIFKHTQKSSDSEIRWPLHSQASKHTKLNLPVRHSSCAMVIPLQWKK